MARQTTKLWSPRGELKYPHLVQPDTKFDADGVYSTKIVIASENCQEFMESIDGIVQKGFDKWAGENKAKAKKTRKILPWSDEIDDDGNETGNIVFNFKVKAKGQNKSGESWDNKVALIDSKGAPVSGVNPWSGTVARVGVEIGDPDFPYANPAGVGVPVRLKICKIIELKAGGNGTAGFDVEAEDGFSADQVEEDSFEETDDNDDL